MGRKQTGRSPGRPKKKTNNSMKSLGDELETVPFQSDFHHDLYDIAASFEAGPEWFQSVETPLRDILGDQMAEQIQAANWAKDGSDFYGLIERCIERTAEGKGTEGEFVSSVVKNIARGFVSKHRQYLDQAEAGDVAGKAFEKIMVAAKYNFTDSKAKKIAYLKSAVFSAGNDLLRERSPKERKTASKELTVRSKSSNIPMPQSFTVEDFLAELGMAIGPKKKAA